MTRTDLILQVVLAIYGFISFAMGVIVGMFTRRPRGK